MLRHVAKHSKKPKTTKLIKLQWIASIWFQSGQKSQNYKSNQIPLNLHRFEVKTIKILRYVAKLQKWSNYNELHWFDVKTFKTFELGRKTTKVIKLQWSASILTSKQSKISSYVANHSKQRKTTKVIKLQWIASIWCQNDQNIWVRS